MDLLLALLLLFCGWRPTEAQSQNLAAKWQRQGHCSKATDPAACISTKWRGHAQIIDKFYFEVFRLFSTCKGVLSLRFLNSL
jgi:hypothetical protein